PLTIGGSGFTSGALVFVGSRLASEVVVSATQIDCVAPAGSGAVRVQVQNPDGRVGISSNSIDYSYSPRIDAVYPGAGSVDGATAVTLSGVGFEPGATVTFAGVVASVVSTEFDRVEVLTPPGAAGTAVIRVENPLGPSHEVSGAFQYLAHPDPTINSVTPGSGSTVSGTALQILGSGFQAGVQVRFGVNADGTGGTIAASVTRRSDTWIEAVTPNLTPGIHSIAVENPDGSKVCAIDAFEAVPPVASSRSSGGGGCSAIVIPIVPGGSGSLGGPDQWGLLTPWLLLIAFACVSRILRRSRPIPTLPA
ncbi:MAG: IPT/TIG domain-containing protein, partial [Planctomycetes bacterium]|nr:IPT/TIG domain-containing protein [Planctomycetota bacterium]